MQNYRLVVITKQENQRHGKNIRTTIFVGPGKEELKKAIHAYHQQPREPWAETTYYYGSRRIYAYEL